MDGIQIVAHTRNASISIQVNSNISLHIHIHITELTRGKGIIEVGCRFHLVPFGRLDCTIVGRDTVLSKYRLSKLERRMHSSTDQEDRTLTPRELYSSVTSPNGEEGRTLDDR